MSIVALWEKNITPIFDRVVVIAAVCKQHIDAIDEDELIEPEGNHCSTTSLVQPGSRFLCLMTKWLMYTHFLFKLQSGIE